MGRKTNRILNDQSGFAFLIALMMMVVLTLLGIAAMSSSTVEIKLSGNKRGATNAFYIADASAQSVLASIGNFTVEDETKYKNVDTNKLPVDLKDEPIDKYYSSPSLPLPSGVTFKVNPQVNIYHMTQKNAPRGAGFSAINFGFEHLLIDSVGKDQMDVASNGATCQIRERVVSIVPTSQGGYE
jgi:hypothetical protein